MPTDRRARLDGWIPRDRGYEYWLWTPLFIWVLYGRRRIVLISSHGRYTEVYLRLFKEIISPVRPNATSAIVPGEGTVANSSSVQAFGPHPLGVFSQRRPESGSAKAAIDTVIKIIGKILFIVVTPLSRSQSTLTFLEINPMPAVFLVRSVMGIT